MGKIIAIANQKGGVAKTTTACSLGVGLSNKDRRVLLIDCDPQANLTEAIGYQQQDEIEITLNCNVDSMFYWALQYGPYVEILEPIDLRNRIAKAVRDMADKYKEV